MLLRATDANGEAGHFFVTIQVILWFTWGAYRFADIKDHQIPFIETCGGQIFTGYLKNTFIPCGGYIHITVDLGFDDIFLPFIGQQDIHSAQTCHDFIVEFAFAPTDKLV